MLCHFAGYWVIGLPVGALLCFHFGFGAAGLWEYVNNTSWIQLHSASPGAIAAGHLKAP
jgi:Na+-driven multidrug efflux pump